MHCMHIEEKGRSTRLAVLVQPRAARTEVVGWHGDALKVRVAAPPVEGAANQELIRFLARRLRVPQSAVTVARGSSGRRKLIEVEGVTAAHMRAALLDER
jgi:uncharacterized protein (TIGR00251 family)